MKNQLPHCLPAEAVLWCFLSLLPVTLANCRGRSHSLLSLLDYLEAGSGPVYLFTDPSRSSNDPFAVRNMILSALNNAATSIDFWFYEFDDPFILEALVSAKNRGVRLTLTGSPDQDYHELHRAGLYPGIRAKSGIQHAKLLFVDHRVLISGTGNFTRSCMFYNDNVFFRTTVDEPAANRILLAMSEEDRFHPPVEWRDGLAHFRLIVSPQAGRIIQSALVQSVLDARSSVRFLIFTFTDPILAGALIEKAREGISVEGVFESYGAARPEPGSAIDGMNNVAGLAPLFIYADGNNHVFYDEEGVLHGGKVHHKTLIVDNRTVYTGSFNWSASARDSNLEAFYEIDDPLAPPAFTAAFERIRSEALIVGRPPVPPDPLPRWNTGISFCPPGTEFKQLTFHTGHGAFFRGLLFSPDDCNAPDSASAGFQSSHQFSAGVPPSGDMLVDFRAGSFSTDDGWPDLPLPFKCNALSCDPCSNRQCHPLSLRRISLQEGWALTNPGTVSPLARDLWIWHQNGMKHSLARMVDNELLVFDGLSSAPSGGVLFLSGPDGILHIACAFRSPPAAPETLLNALPWFYPETFAGGIPCTAPD